MSYILSETEPDENGYFTRVEVYVNAAGQKIKATIKMRRTLQEVRIKRAILERRAWREHKFGDCLGKGIGAEENITLKSPQTVSIEKLKGECDAEEKNESVVDVVVRCRLCGGGHFTLKCPERSKASATLDAAATTKTSGVQGGRDSKSRPPDFGIKINNLTLEATDEDIRELCRRFGRITRVYIGNGFAYVNFREEHEVAKAIARLDKHLYDSQVLSVAKAMPRGLLGAPIADEPLFITIK